jgi:hypothetical protein
MARGLNLRRPRGVAAGGILGAVLGVLVTFGVDLLVSGPQSLWWPPAVGVVCAIGGAVLGMLFAVEIEDESDDSSPSR